MVTVNGKADSVLQTPIAEQQKPPMREAELLHYLGAHVNRPVPGQGISQIIGRILPEHLRPQARVFATKLVAPKEKIKAQKLAQTQQPLQLHLGCGTFRLTNWINIDLVGLPVDLAWDIRSPLPFPDGSASAVFHEHVMEHISGIDGYHFLKECYRVLKPNGVLRIVMPDASKYIKSYLDPEHEFIRGWRGERPTPMIALQEEFYGFGHRAVYDYETAELFCRTVGFRTVEQKQFGESRLTPCPDSEWRITDSFYAEAVK